MRSKLDSANWFSANWSYMIQFAEKKFGKLDHEFGKLVFGKLVFGKLVLYL